MIRVLLADDQALVRAGFASLLDGEDDIEVVGEASDGVEAVALARDLVPDVVLLDIRRPRLDGLEATRQIAQDPEAVEIAPLQIVDPQDHASALREALQQLA